MPLMKVATSEESRGLMDHLQFRRISGGKVMVVAQNMAQKQKISSLIDSQQFCSKLSMYTMS